MRPVDVAPPAQRCVLRRKSCAHICVSLGNQTYCVRGARRTWSKPCLGSDPYFGYAASKTIATSARSSIGDKGVFMVFAIGFKHCSSIAYRRKSSFVSGFSVKWNTRPVGFLS